MNHINNSFEAVNQKVAVLKLCHKKQEMPSWHQKCGKKGSESYLMFKLNHILVALRWDGGRSSDHPNVCQWFLNGRK